jgi:dephospho-CoA kinase
MPCGTAGSYCSSRTCDWVDGRRGDRRPFFVDPDPTWPEQARRLIERLCFDAGRILRADHIGSTSVPGLPAKQLLDIQIVVADLADAVQVAEAARRAGFVRARGSWFGTDRYGVDYREEVVVDADPARPVNGNTAQ